MAGVTDPNIVHETMAKLDASTIYLESEVEGLVHDYLAHKGNNALTKWITILRRHGVGPLSSRYARPDGRVWTRSMARGVHSFCTYV